MYLNKVILIGHVGKVYESKNPSICSFSLATTEKWMDKQTSEWKSETEWHRINCFGHAAEKARNLVKGEHIIAEGTIKTNKFVDKNGVEKESKEIKAFTIKSLMRKKEKDNLKSNVNGNVQEEAYTKDAIPF